MFFSRDAFPKHVTLESRLESCFLERCFFCSRFFRQPFIVFVCVVFQTICETLFWLLNDNVINHLSIYQISDSRKFLRLFFPLFAAPGGWTTRLMDEPVLVEVSLLTIKAFIYIFDMLWVLSVSSIFFVPQKLEV